MSATIIRRKKGGLSNIKTKGGSITPRVFAQEEQDYDSNGVVTGEYKGHTLPDAKEYLSPKWNDMKNRWCWGGTPEQLAEIISKLRLKFPKDHPFVGQFISGDKIDPRDRLRDFNDDFFNHPSLYGNVYLQEGKTALDPDNNTMHKFLYLCYLGDHNVDNKTKNQNSFFTAGATLEMISPKEQRAAKAVDVKKELKAAVLLDAMSTNEDRMRRIAEIMKLPGYGPSTETHGVLILLRDQAVNNTETASRFGDKVTYQERFIELANMKDGDLDMDRTILLGKNKGKIRSGKPYMFRGEKLEGVINEYTLIKYFRDPANQDKYLDLLKLIET